MKKTNIILLIGLIISIIAIVFLINKNNNLEVDKNISEQNKKALADSLRTSRNKVGDLEFSKNILVSEKNNLKDLNEDLDKELKKQKGKVFQLTKYIAKIEKEKDTIKVTNTVVEYRDGVKGLKWEYEKIYDPKNYRKLSGISKFKIDSLGLLEPLETQIIDDEIVFNVIQGLREKDGNVEMFVRSDYPGFSLEDLNSVIIDPNKHPVLRKYTKKKRFGLSLYGGYGLTLTNNTVMTGTQIGAGLTYDLIQF